MALRMSIAPQGIADLLALNWLGRRNCGYPASVADVVTGLASAALAAGLWLR